MEKEATKECQRGDEERCVRERRKKEMLERGREKGKFQGMHEEGGKRDTLTEGVDIFAMALKEG